MPDQLVGHQTITNQMNGGEAGIRTLGGG
ncbi:uncharacterized protein METZ01_LOCUS107990 [marine metagenome]|uniref:Uncharacterized protein n=1 Tax=marine metagenome TaxID=408172 RepID=A0A381WRJ4_9ZZZZ